MEPCLVKAGAGPSPDLGELAAEFDYAEGVLALMAFRDEKSMLRAPLEHHKET